MEEDYRMKVVVLLSGGMDSVCSLYYSKEKYNVIAAVSFDYGSKYNHKELPYASYHCGKLKIPHTVMKVGFVDDYFESSLMKDGSYAENSKLKNVSSKTIVPFRNGMMLAIAIGFAESLGGEGVVIAAHSGDYSAYPDCREKFLKLMSQAAKAGTYNKVKILRPFVYLSKEEIVKIGRKLDVDFSKTWSCNKGDDIHCGECDTCLGRREAFNSARVSDPTVYNYNEPLSLDPLD